MLLKMIIEGQTLYSGSIDLVLSIRAEKKH